MGIRVVNGNDHTEDGWPLVDQAGCTWIVVPGTNPPVHLQIQSGQPQAILGAFVADWNANIEHVRDDDSACWTESNDVLGDPGENNGSNHLGGTACDVNWRDHPFHQSYAGFDDAKIATMRQMLDFYEKTVWWGEDWGLQNIGPFDCMHVQMGGDTFNNPHTQDFINRKIRPDGLSTFRRGAAPPMPPAAQVLSAATGLSLDRANQILPTVVHGLAASVCNNVNRIAMWLAQCGEESAGFSTTEEFASGAEYEGRCSDLGNCSPGDGVKYKGRTWIQITGKAHYQEFSAWAFGKGFVGSPTQFVDNPTSLGDLQWAGIGAAWYWTVSRPQINSLCDAGDIVGVTKAINGGTNGLQDRTDRYNRARALGDQLLALITSVPQPPQPQPGEDDWLNMPSNQEKLDAIFNAFFNPQPPEDIYREASETVGQNLVDSIKSILSMVYEGVIVERLALLGEQASIDKVVRVARGEGPEQRQWAVQRADLIWQRGQSATVAPPVGSAPVAAIPPAPAAPDGRDLALSNAYTEIARLNAVIDRLQAISSVPVSTEVAKVESAALTLGQSVGGKVDADQEWAKVSLALDKVQQHALDVSIQGLKMQTNGTEQ